MALFVLDLLGTGMNSFRVVMSACVPFGVFSKHELPVKLVADWTPPLLTSPHVKEGG